MTTTATIRWLTLDGPDAETFFSVQRALTPEEEARLKAIVPERRLEHAAAWVLSRHTVAARAGVEMAAVRIDRSEDGEPVIARPEAATRQYVSITHSGGLLAVAVAEVPIGVDVEAPSERRSVLAIAERFFDPAERARLEALAPTLREAAFRQMWTRKEAFSKAIGHGLVLPLDACVVVPDGDGWEVRFGPKTREQREAWTFASFDVAAPWVGALAIRAVAPTLDVQRVESLSALLAAPV